jgi:hypothetical protein
MLEAPRLIDLVKDWISAEEINQLKTNQDYIIKNSETSSE